MVPKTKIPKRSRSMLTKGEIRGIAADVIANLVETSAGAMKDVFIVKVLQGHERTPTEGEEAEFLKVVAAVSTGLKKRSNKYS